MSATRSEHGARQSLDAGGEDFLVKPLIRELLEKKVASVLERERGYACVVSLAILLIISVGN